MMSQHHRTMAELEAEWAETGPSPADLRAGWQTIAADPLLRLVVVQATVGATLLLVLLSLLPGLATRHLGVSVADAPFLILPGGLAFVLAAVQNLIAIVFALLLLLALIAILCAIVSHLLKR